jgi:hypothetical protein
VSYTVKGSSPEDAERIISRMATFTSANFSPFTCTLREDGNGPVVTLKGVSVFFVALDAVLAMETLLFKMKKGKQHTAVVNNRQLQ